MLKVDLGVLTNRFSPIAWPDQEVIPFAATVLTWGRWFCWLVAVSGLVTDPPDWYPTGAAYVLVYIPYVTLNGIVHFRLLTNRPVTWRWLLVLSVMDSILITSAIVIGGGFDSYTFLAYYPAVAAFAAVFTSFWLGMAWGTMVALAYVLVCSSVGPGLDIPGDLKELVSRLAVIYAVVLCIGLIARFERARRETAVERERQMQLERVEVSQAIHDTSAQTAYMIGLGIHRARELADESNEELVAALDETAALSRSAMWELRRPIDSGHIFEGRELGRVLRSHCASFERITGVPTELSQSGTEPRLTTEVRSRLFSIAHNALTNALLHARPGRVGVRLDFEVGRIRMSVSDDGVGLPDDYADRGRGFQGMRADAAALGGELDVESGEGQDGTTITCVVPHETGREGA